MFLLFSILPSNELVVEGPSLEFALDHSLRNDFIELCCKCSSVICCRVSPMQKAEMVELVIRINLFNFLKLLFPTSVAVRLATNYEKLADVVLLPFYCQNTLVTLLLINFKLAWSYI
jgi:hypothetical protein